MKGLIHSIDSFGTVDGPGIRMVVFFKGCPMRCLYCHNPDTWNMDGATEKTVDEILAEYNKSKSFYRNGGLTASGGEPLLQMDFLIELFKSAHEKGIHTALDTSGITFEKQDKTLMSKFDELIKYTSLVMLDIKHVDNEEHLKLTGKTNKNILDFSKYLDENNIPICIRHVVVPGITFDKKYLLSLGEYIGTLKNLKSIDILPYHDMGKTKYNELNIPYPLINTKPLSKEDAIKAKKIILTGIKKTRKAK